MNRSNAKCLKLRNFMSKSQLSNERGMTLIELLAAMTILSIIVLAVAALYQYSMHHSSINQKKTTALMIAQEKIDELTAQIEQSRPAAGSLNETTAWEKDRSFQIHVTDTALTEPLTIPWERDQVTLQSIVTMSLHGREVQRLLAVTVYWGDSSGKSSE